MGPRYHTATEARTDRLVRDKEKGNYSTPTIQTRLKYMTAGFVVPIID